VGAVDGPDLRQAAVALPKKIGVAVKLWVGTSAAAVSVAAGWDVSKMTLTLTPTCTSSSQSFGNLFHGIPVVVSAEPTSGSGATGRRSATRHTKRTTKVSLPNCWLDQEKVVRL
jgi:hypothetical protein